MGVHLSDAPDVLGHGDCLETFENQRMIPLTLGETHTEPYNLQINRLEGIIDRLLS